jgi:hypothetical protein
MYEDKRPTIKLSKECWDCLDVLKDISYANAYTFFWADQIKLIQQGIRKIIPDINGDLLRFRYEGKTITFSLSDEAIIGYKPKIQEFSSFGSVVKMLGAYENYVRRIVEISYQFIPKEMKNFKSNHRKDIRNTKSFIKHEVGRGVDFFSEVFGYTPHLSYRPSLQFIFQLRNVAVHNSCIADQRLCDAANNKYVNIEGKLKIGDTVKLNLSSSLQLHHLLTSILSEVDPHIYPTLKLPVIEKQAYWYLDDENDHK